MPWVAPFPFRVWLAAAVFSSRMEYHFVWRSKYKRFGKVTSGADRRKDKDFFLCCRAATELEEDQSEGLFSSSPFTEPIVMSRRPGTYMKRGKLSGAPPVMRFSAL